MRVVLDTNVIVSALLSREGPPGRVLVIIQQQERILVTSVQQLEELRSVFARDRIRKRIRPHESEKFVQNIDGTAFVVTELPHAFHSLDQDDNDILATAMAGDADLIVSGDKKHMLSLGQVEGISIVTPREALRRLSK